MRLLLIEDETQIGKYLVKGLAKSGFAVDWEQNGKSGLDLLEWNEYDCLILDLNLPDIDGLDIMNRLKEQNIEIPTLILTARTTQNNVLEGFKTGADDYLCKPFDFQELIYRIRALVKRNCPNKDTYVKVGDLEFDTVTKKAFISGQEISLNNKELGILEYLLKHRGRAISQEELLEHVWDREIDTFTETIRTNIKTLRKKIDKDKKLILTIRGRGYVIN